LCVGVVFVQFVVNKRDLISVRFLLYYLVEKLLIHSDYLIKIKRLDICSLLALLLS